jgi:hypothetical protein
MLLTDSDHDSTVMRHHRHALLEHSPFKAFVTHLTRTAREQTGDVTFHHRTTIATGTGSVHLMWGSLAV